MEGVWSMERREIEGELRRMIRGRNNDAIKLICMNGEMPDIGKLDLKSVTEFKRSEKGCFEVKFVDRLKALELLERISGQSSGDELGHFMEELREGETI